VGVLVSSLAAERLAKRRPQQFGTAIAGTILVSDRASGNTSYVLAMVVLGFLALIGLAAAIRLPADAQAAS
jgi:hypothetical protein